LTEIQSAQWVESANSFFLQKNDSLNANLKITMAFSQPYCSSREDSYDYAVSAIQYEVLNWKGIRKW
jgi:hypothetical protein